MELSLVPIEGERILSEEEKERAARRARKIPPEALSRFGDDDRKQIRGFLTSLITLAEQFHHEMSELAQNNDSADFHKERIEQLQVQRKALFDAPLPPVADFIELLQFFVMEPWPEFEMMIAGIRGEDQQLYYEAKLKAAVDPFRMEAEGDLERAQDEQMDGVQKCRITPSEIEELVEFHSLESLVKNLVHGRKLMNGEFWDASHYDL